MNHKIILLVFATLCFTHRSISAGICNSLIKKQLAEEKAESSIACLVKDLHITPSRTIKKKTKIGLHQKLRQRELTGRCSFRAEKIVQYPCFQEEIKRDIARINECDRKHPEVYWKWMKELPLEYQLSIVDKYPTSLPSLLVFTKKELLDALSNNIPVHIISTPACIVSGKIFGKQKVLSVLQQISENDRENGTNKKDLIWGLELQSQNLTNHELEEFLNKLSPDWLQDLSLLDNQISDFSRLLPYRYLRSLNLKENPIGEITDLAALTSLTCLDVFKSADKPLSQDGDAKIQRFLRARTQKRLIEINYIPFLNGIPVQFIDDIPFIDGIQFQPTDDLPFQFE